MDNWNRPFLRSMLSEQDGTVSSARFCIVLVILVSLSWVSWLVVHDKKMPDLSVVATYTTLVCGSLYAINRSAAVIDRKSQQGGNTD